jgi:hypothetical protein
MTVIVTLLLGSALFSIGGTDNYDLALNGTKMPADQPDWRDHDLDDLDERIHVLLSFTHHVDKAPVKPVKVYVGDTGAARTDTTLSTVPDEARQILLEAGAIVFSTFGLFVLWWGRDRASFWLGMFCVAFGTAMVQFFGALPATGMLAAIIADSLLEVVSIYALYALAEAVTLESVRPDDRLRDGIIVVRAIAVITVALMVLNNAGMYFWPVVLQRAFPDPLPLLGAWVATFAEMFVLTAAPLTLLLLGALRARDPSARSRAIVIFLTTLCALSGVIYSIGKALLTGGGGGFDSWWFTLLFIPVGFIVTISAYRVVEVKFFINRLLVLTGMTLILGIAITASETWLEGFATRSVGRAMGHVAAAPAAPRDGVNVTIDFIVACAIVLSFSTVHRFVDRIVERIVYRRRDEGVAALREFAVHRASFVTARAALLEQAVALVQQSVGAVSAAIYSECATGYECSASHGEWQWPAVVGVDDPTFVALRSESEPVDLASLEALESAFGADGVAVRMAVGGRVTGALIVMPRLNEGDGPYAREELEAFDDIARGVADALFTLRSTETAAFVQAIADGKLAGSEAIRRAQALCECEAPPPAAAATVTRLETVRSAEPA